VGAGAVDGEHHARHVLPALAAAITSILVGAAMVATRSVASGIGPGSLALLRYAIGGLLLLPVFLADRRRQVALTDAAKIGGLGILQFAVVVGLLNLSLRHIPSARAALLFSLCPILTLILESVLQRRWPTVLQSIGVLLALAGVGVAFGWQAIAGTAALSWLGDGCAFGSAWAAAVCALSYRPFLARYGARRVGAYALPAAVVVLAALAAIEGFYTSPLLLSQAGWLSIFFIGGSSAVGYLLWLWALNRASPTRVTVFLTLNPISAAAFGALLLGECVGLAYAIGVIGVLCGIWLAYR